MHTVNNHTAIVLRRRVNRTTYAMSLLTIFCGLKRTHSELDTETLIVLKCRSRCLNGRDSYDLVQCVAHQCLTQYSIEDTWHFSLHFKYVPIKIKEKRNYTLLNVNYCKTFNIISSCMMSMMISKIDMS